MKKIVILLIVMSSLFSQWKHQTNPTTIRQLYVLDENHIKHHSSQLEWRRDNQILLIHDIQYAMRMVKKGKYNQNRSQDIADLVQKYVDLEQNHREELKLIRTEIRKLTKWLNNKEWKLN